MSQVVLGLNILSQSMNEIDIFFIENFIAPHIFYIEENDNNFLKEVTKNVLKTMF